MLRLGASNLHRPTKEYSSNRKSKYFSPETVSWNSDRNLDTLLEVHTVIVWSVKNYFPVVLMIKGRHKWSTRIGTSLTRLSSEGAWEGAAVARDHFGWTIVLVHNHQRLWQPFRFPTPFWTFYRVKNGTTLWSPHHWGDMARDKGGGLRIAVDIRSLSILRNIDVLVSPFPWFLANGILSFSSPYGRQKCRRFFCIGQCIERFERQYCIEYLITRCVWSSQSRFASHH